MRNFANSRKILLITCILIGIGWCRISSRIYLFDDKDEMQQEILKYIPIGSSIDKAKIEMEKSGFDCYYWDNPAYSKKRSSSVLNEHSYLFCDKQRSFILAYKIWHVDFLYKEKIVTKVNISIGWVNLWVVI
jgi:hypothetical protein